MKIVLSICFLFLSQVFAAYSNLRTIKVMSEVMEPPEPPEDSENEAELYRNLNYTHSHEGSEIEFEHRGGQIRFIYNNITLSISLHRLQELGKNETTGEVFPLIPLDAPEDDHPHLEDDFEDTRFSYTAVDKQKIGNVNFTHFAVQTNLNGGANFTLHVFQALTTGTATIWDKTYDFQPGAFKFGFALTNWNFCPLCKVQPTADWDDGAAELPEGPERRRRNLRSFSGGSDDHPPLPEFYDYELPGSYLDVTLKIKSSNNVNFKGDSDATRNATIGENRPPVPKNVDLAVIALPSNYVIGSTAEVMPYGFPVTKYSGNEGRAAFLTFRFDKFDASETLYYDPTVDLTTTSTSTSSSRKKKCFASSETVMLSTGESKVISDVVVGESILAATRDGQFIYDEVIAVPHAKNTDAVVFTRIVTTTGRDIKMTADHLLMAGMCGDSVNMGLMLAQDVTVGNCVRSVAGDESVVAVGTLNGRGISTLVTKRGDYIVVNGMVASPFSTNHAVANAFYNIHRAVYTLFPSLLQSVMLKQSGEIFHELLDTAVSA